MIYGTRHPKNTPLNTSQPGSKSAPKPKSTTVQLGGGVTIDRGNHDTHNMNDTWVLVSKTRPLADIDYTPQVEKVDVPVRNDKPLEEQSLRPEIMPNVRELFAAASASGYDFMMSSGYRSKQSQAMYYSAYSARSGEEAANRYSAKPGQSEHQTGLAFDMNLISGECYLEICLGDLPAGKWLAAHTAAYGFIIRYPEGKEQITGYQYEPWHLRYVGKDLAEALVKSRLTFDEAALLIDAAAR